MTGNKVNWVSALMTQILVQETDRKHKQINSHIYQRMISFMEKMEWGKWTERGDSVSESFQTAE